MLSDPGTGSRVGREGEGERRRARTVEGMSKIKTWYNEKK